jgi:uncharacterized protein (DUF433 family)
MQQAPIPPGLERQFTGITFDPRILGRTAAVRGMRIPVSGILGQIAHGTTFGESLAGYPDLEREDIRRALGRAARPAQERAHIG